ncbi:MAG: SMI1/KNR4 family protein [bacterium]
MRWYMTKGDSWWMATFDDEGGVEVTTHDGAPESLDFSSQDDAMTAIRERVVSLLAQGYKETTHPDDKYLPDPTVDAWYHTEFFDLLGAAKRAQSRGMVARLEADLNCTFPPDVRRFLEFRDTHNFGYTNFAEWRIWDADLDLPDMGVSNRFEQLILLDQQNYLGTAMSEAFMSAVFLGTAGNGDSYFATQAEDEDDFEILYWNHETAQPEFAIADRISTFAFANHLLNQVEEFDIEEEMGLIEERAHLSWHYSSIEEESGIEPTYNRRGNAMYYFWRANWINYLLRNNQVVKVAGIPDYFIAQIHQGLTWEDVLKFHHIRQTPATQYYWLWRLFWFNKPELAQMLELAANAPSPLVRDCGALIAELQNGRKQLGTIQDIHALREQFLALDLDPDPARVAQREAEKLAAERAAEEAHQSALDDVHALTKSASRQELIDAAWTRVENLEAVEVIYDHLKTHEDIAWGMRRVDFLTESHTEFKKG